MRTLSLLDLAQHIPLQAQVFLLSLIPLLELRLAIPYGVANELSPYQATMWGIAGNIFQAPLAVGVIWSLYYVIDHYLPWAAPYLHRIERRVAKYQTQIQRFGIIGLILLVAVPIPGSGIWTASVLGRLARINFWPTVAANIIGVAAAGVLTGLASAGIFGAIRFFM